MTTVTQVQIASRAGHQYGMEHPFADASTAQKTAYRLFATTEAREAFMRSWRYVAGF
jgi:hypothetical protein